MTWVSTAGALHIWEPALSPQPRQHLFTLQASPLVFHLISARQSKENSFFMSELSLVFNLASFSPPKRQQTNPIWNGYAVFQELQTLNKQYQFPAYLTSHPHTELLQMALFQHWASFTLLLIVPKKSPWVLSKSEEYRVPPLQIVHKTSTCR